MRNKDMKVNVNKEAAIKGLFVAVPASEVPARPG
jgi:hypothetical protein